METVENYGNLSDKELREFLAAIESEDDDLSYLEEQAKKNIADGEYSVPDEMLDDGAWSTAPILDKTKDGRYKYRGSLYFTHSDAAEYKKKEWEERRAKGVAASVQRAKERRQKKILVTRAAVNQNDVMLSDPVTQEQLKMLIAELVKDHTATIDGLFEYINKRFSDLLRPLVPRALQNCAKAYPQSVKRCKGFMYKASYEFGKGHCFWATPDIPYFFTQGTEQELLEKVKPDFLYRIDKAIANYMHHIDMRTTKELKYASVLVDRHVKTYYDLLKYNPFWFETLYKLVTNKELELCTTNY